LFVVGACHFSSPAADDTVGPDGGPDATTSDPHLDTDADGVLDTVDNCVALANPDQRDHDLDGRGDVCDVCPHLPDAGGDADGDGVGDACDPRPTQPGDRIAFFEDFNSTPAWDAVIGSNTWHADAGLERQDQTDGVYQLVRNDTPDLGNVFVEARFKVNQLANTTTRRSVALVVGHVSPQDFMFCGLAAGQQTTEVNVGKVFTDTSFDYNRATFGGQMAGDFITLQVRTSEPPGLGTHIECLSRRGMTNAHAAYDTGLPADGDIGLRTNGVDASFDYVFAVEVPPPTQ
jgi:hypothetical protein